MGRIRLSPLPTIKELLKLYNVRALRQLSQNFLLQLSVTNKIVKAAGNLRDCEVCEIGPGPGAITRSLLWSRAGKILAIEKDTRFKPILEALQYSAQDKLKVVYADILDYDLSDAFDNSLKKDWEDFTPKIKIIGNLPFNIASVLIIQFLRDISLRRNAWSYGRVCLTLTFQKEVAERICTNILSKYRCRLSVMCQNWCKVSHKLTLPGHTFLPKPEVDVGVVHFEPLVKPVIDLDFNMIEKVFRTAFNCRQKFIRKTMMHLFPQEVRPALTEELFEISGIEPTVRPYELTLEEWKQLVFAYKHICDRDPQLYTYDFRGSKKLREIAWKENKQMAIN